MDLDLSEAQRLIRDAHAQVVDVRDKESFRAGHIPGAIALDQTNVGTFIESADRERPLIVCCYHGNMSQGAADYFSRQGFERAYSLDGGYTEWVKQA